ncbi:MAG: sugar transferase, partial [Omnitrophica bacterium]|nr:sugar transferase [Candidatus Omnitrophota bacterium]
PGRKPHVSKSRDYRRLGGDLNIEVKKYVKRKGVVMMPGRTKHFKRSEFILNAGVLTLDGKRFLFPRLTYSKFPPRKDMPDDLRYSKIGLVIHKDPEKIDPEKITSYLNIKVNLCGEIIPLDANLLRPDDFTSKENPIVSLEDAHVIERDARIYVYLTAVKRDGTYYSVVTSHAKKTFLTNVGRLLQNPQAGVTWSWKPLKRLIARGRYAKINNKNFVPFGNPMGGKWYALYRPDEEGTRTIRLAESEGGLAGPWKDAGEYRKVKRKGRQRNWIGVSAYGGESSGRYEFMWVHSARQRKDDSKHYDIGLIIADKKNPRSYVIKEAILVPKKDKPFEYDEKAWFPGAIYTTGVILKSLDDRKKKYVFDVYYTGSDTAILMAEVTITIRDKSEAAASLLSPADPDAIRGKHDAARERASLPGSLDNDAEASSPQNSSLDSGGRKDASKESTPAVRVKAAEMLARLPLDENAALAIPSLEAMLRQEKDPAVRAVIERNIELVSNQITVQRKWADTYLDNGSPGPASSPAVSSTERENFSAKIGRVVAIAILPLALLVIFFLASVVKVSTKGPAFFAQERVGYQGSTINIWKIRTWTDKKTTKEHKKTRFGKLIKPTGLDEAPQIFSIIKGDMQWFGPRPRLKYESTQEYIDKVFSATKPGIYSTSALIKHRQQMGLEVDSIVVDDMRYDLQDIEKTAAMYNFKILAQVILMNMVGPFYSLNRLRKRSQSQPVVRPLESSSSSPGNSISERMHDDEFGKLLDITLEERRKFLRKIYERDYSAQGLTGVQKPKIGK